MVSFGSSARINVFLYFVFEGFRFNQFNEWILVIHGCEDNGEFPSSGRHPGWSKVVIILSWCCFS
jgi:hypothetical protein